MSTGYSQGIFLDQRDHRRQVRERSAPGMRVLNTFAYTGAFSVYAALGGAQTTTLDLAQPCLDWARENFSLNGIDPATQYFCKGDVRRWLERFSRQGRTFHGIILDPPPSPGMTGEGCSGWNPTTGNWWPRRANAWNPAAGCCAPATAAS